MAASPPARRMNSTICAETEQRIVGVYNPLFCLSAHPLEELAAGAARGGKDDNLQAERHREAGAEDGYAVGLPEAARSRNENLAIAALPAVLFHDHGPLRLPLALVDDARGGLHEGLVELQRSTAGVRTAHLRVCAVCAYLELLRRALKPARVHAPQQLLQRAHVHVAAVHVARHPHPQPVELVLRLLGRALVHGRHVLLDGALEGERLAPARARVLERLDVRVKAQEERVAHQRAQPLHAALVVLLVLVIVQQPVRVLLDDVLVLHLRGLLLHGAARARAARGPARNQS